MKEEQDKLKFENTKKIFQNEGLYWFIWTGWGRWFRWLWGIWNWSQERFFKPRGKFF